MSILNVTTEDVKSQNTGQGGGGGFNEDPNLFNPTHTKADNGVYEAVIRFIPYPHDPRKSEYHKRFAILKHPLTNDRQFIDDPANDGYNSPFITLSILLNKNFKQSEPQVVENIQKYFQQSYYYISPVYIKKALYEEDSQDTIKFFKYKKTIHDLIEKQREANPNLGIQGVEPFSLVNGKDFFVKVTKGDYGRNWEGCRFLDSVSHFEFKYNGKNITINKDDEKYEQAYKKFYEQTAPDMEQYFHTPMTDEDYETAVNYIYDIVDYRAILNKLVENVKDEKFKNMLKDKMQGSVESTHSTSETVKPESNQSDGSQAEATSDVTDELLDNSDKAQSEGQTESSQSQQGNEDDIDELLGTSSDSSNDEDEGDIEDILNS